MNKSFSKASRLTQILIVMGGTIIYELITYTLKVTFLNMPIELLSTARVVLIEAVYNALIVSILYRTIMNLGGYLEESVEGMPQVGLYIR